MGPLDSVGRLMIFMGIILVVVGGIMVFSGKLFNLGRLPGDIFVQRGNFTFYFPLATSIIISIVLTLLLSILFRR